MFKLRSLSPLKGSLLSLGAITTYYYLDHDRKMPLLAEAAVPKISSLDYPTRKEMINLLKGKTRSGSDVENSEFDLLIVGGGATGVGCALDASSRGLKVALVERDDFASGAILRFI